MTDDMAQFDAELLANSGSTPEVVEALSPWIAADSMLSKRERVPRVVCNVAQALARSLDLRMDVERLKLLSANIRYFEDLTIGVQSGLAGRFYRDHLNHLVRTFLLMKNLGSRIARTAFPGQDTASWGLEGLLHDAAYPVEAVGKILPAMNTSIEKTYAGRYVDVRGHFGTKASAVLSPLEEIGILESLGGLVHAMELAEHLNHGVVGAAEALKLFEARSQANHLVRDICLAIALHDVRVGGKLVMSRSPRAACLVIADELQDWGRAVGYETSPVMSSLRTLQLDQQSIFAEMVPEVERARFAIHSIRSKIANLQRIVLDLPLVVAVSFHLPSYRLLGEMPGMRGLLGLLGQLDRQLVHAWESNMQACGLDAKKCEEGVDHIWIDSNLSELVCCEGMMCRQVSIVGTHEMGWELRGEDGSNLAVLDDGDSRYTGAVEAWARRRRTLIELLRSSGVSEQSVREGDSEVTYDDLLGSLDNCSRLAQESRLVILSRAHGRS